MIHFFNWEVDSLSGTIINSLLDNPCLSRSLTADYSNSTCYKQTATTVTTYGRLWSGARYEASTEWVNGCRESNTAPP